MDNKQCKADSGMKTILGIFFGFITLGLILIGITYLPVIGIFMAAISFVISILFFLAPKDESCYLNR